MIAGRPNSDAWSLLMARAQDGDRDSYRILLTEITPFARAIILRRMAGSADVEDVVQDTLLTLHMIRHTYDPTRPFRPWLAAIAERRAIDRLRRRGRLATHEVAIEPHHETSIAAATNTEQDRPFEAEALRKAITTLSPGQKQAIELLKLKELSLKEAASQSGLTVAALKVASHRAVKALRLALGSRQ